MRGALLFNTATTWTVTALLLSHVSGQEPDIRVLSPAEPIQRHIARGEEHPFTVSLAAGTTMSVVVEQKGIDVGVSIRDVEGKPICEFQDELRREGEERAEIVAVTTGTYTVAIKPADSAVAPGDYVIRIAASREATETDRRLQQSRTLRTLARQLERTGQFPEARTLMEQSLAIAEPLVGADDTYVAMLRFELAGNALEAQDNARSRALYERALAAFDKVWGSAHPYAAMTRSRMALLDERAGQRLKAEAGIREVLPLLERALGSTHPWYVLSRVTFANLRQSAGDLQQAEQVDRDALASIQMTGQTGTLLEATLLTNLADVLRAKNDIPGAEGLFKQSLAIGESVIRSDSLFVATALQNLGIMARERKDYAAAISYYNRALSIRERLLGLDHPSLAGVLTNLANVYRATGNDQKALETHFRALNMWEKSVGPYGRETLIVVGNIARTYAGAGDIENAITFQRRADTILEMQLGLYVATGSERQKLAFVRNEADRTDRTISLHLKQAPDNPDAAALAALVLLQRKGRVQDAMTDLFASARQRVTSPDDRLLMDELKETDANLARIALGGGRLGAPDVRESVAQIESRKEQLEATLSERSAEFRAEVCPVTLEAVQAAIPRDAVLVEFAVFRPFDPEAERNEEAYGPPHYAAYVVSRHDAPIGIDLGAVEDIDPLVVGMRKALRDPANADVKAKARALDERIMRPLRALVTGATRLLISPDGGLNLVPFETLVDEHGRYLIERYATTYLTSGRDLLRMQSVPAAPGKPVIVADPLFGEPTATVAHRGPSKTAEDSRSVTVGADLSGLYFAPLLGSALEGRAIKALFPDASLLTGRRATKSTLAQVAAPSILHIASHGFFLEDDASAGSESVIAQNPLLRSGLALAGANLTGSTQGDGILTALEAASLNLWGTRLVTLSACDTGVGDVHNGEGVYGLRRAFMLAGAETLVMSLWPVSDAVARDTMVAYYARLRSGAGRGDALRQAKLSILRRPAMRHPYYWGGFIQSGDWTRLPSSH
jgi:CHAT domain-containing protein/tetratricopeptide (TPR) repeat protein